MKQTSVATTTLNYQASTTPKVSQVLKFVRPLKKGMSGPEVKELQTFLAQFPGVYPEGMVTGYFGALTEAAVKRFQTEQGIVTSGSPETTGFGQIGPKTVLKLNVFASMNTTASVQGSVNSSNNSTQVNSSSQSSVVSTQTATSTTMTSSSTSSVTTVTVAAGGGGGSASPSPSPTPSPSPSSSPTPDTTVPVVSITSPTNGATVTADFALTATASDNVAVTSLIFYIDGAYYGPGSGSSPYSVNVSASSYSNGSHALAAVARDAAGNVATSTINLTFAAIPAGTISAALNDPTPASSLVVSNSVPKVASFKFTALNDSFTITELTAKVPTAGDATAITDLVFKDGGTTLGSQAFTGAIATKTSLSIAVSANSTKVIDVYANLGSIGSGAGNIGANVGATLTGFKAQGSTGPSTNYNTSLSGNAAYAYKTKPTLANVALPSTVLSGGTQTIAKINLTADAGGTLAWRKLVWNYTKNSSAALTNLALYDAADASTPLAGTTVASTSNTITVTSSVDQEVAGSKTYLLKATFAGTISSGDNLSLNISTGVGAHSSPSTYASVSSGATFVWSDESASSHSDTSLDWMDDFLVRNLPLEQQTMSN